uniref:double homeobox protein A n=1 Tax=Odobenus rosmarus divergens TaxID=9708 RepID=UPI00063CF4DE|nr:PREDICTED: double homeobox protein A [Odobenus rosmarus divergens]
MNQRRSRTKFTEDQLKILIKAFDQNPYPGYATKQRLALEINTDESRIQIWFQNRRARHQCQKKSEPNEDLESSQDQDHSEEEIQSREDRRCRTSYTSSQLHTLIEAFMNNPYPGIDTREQLAKETGIPESRVQIWFQNRRSRFHVQRKREPDDQDSEQRQDQEQNLWDERVQVSFKRSVRKSKQARKPMNMVNAAVFSLKLHLTGHQKGYSGEKLYGFNRCGKAFTDQSLIPHETHKVSYRRRTTLFFGFQHHLVVMHSNGHRNSQAQARSARRDTKSASALSSNVQPPDGKKETAQSVASCDNSLATRAPFPPLPVTGTPPA